MADSIAKALQQDGDVKNGEDGLVFDPYNSQNKQISAHQVQGILRSYGVPSPLYNIELYKRAFVHRSYTRRPILENEAANVTIVERPPECLPLKTKSNERLEFLGDGVLELITKYYLYRRFPKADEGFMTEKKIALVKNEHIGKLAYDMGLHRWLIVSRHAEEKKTRTNLKKLGCLFEAFLGALFLDFNKISVKDEHGWFANTFPTGPGFQMAQVFVEMIFETHVDWTRLIQTDDNYKNILQVKIQRAFKTTPDYIELACDPETGYRMGVFVRLGKELHEVDVRRADPLARHGSLEAIQKQFEARGHVFVLLATSTHKIKKKAEQSACKQALDALAPGDS
jgi:dsRNA-specific ribonuclease